MQHKIISCLYGFGLFVLMMIFESCSTGGSALPQTSLPLPENDPVTVSAPNYQGFVTVTGAESAVPESVVVVITVGDATSSNMNWNSISEFLLPEALATTCSSDLPQCPDLSSDHQCQYTASADGSFTLTVPATLSSTISVGYLDPTSCAETSAYTETVDDTVVSVNIDVSSAKLGFVTNTLYLLGTNISGNNIIEAYSVATGETTDYTLSSLQSQATGFGEVYASDGSYYLVVTTEDETQIFTVDTNGVIDSSNPVTIVDSSGVAMTGLNFLNSQSDVYSSSDSCPTAELVSDGDLYTRLFFYKEGNLYTIDFVDNPATVETSFQYSTNNIIPRTVNINFDGYLTDTGANVSSSDMTAVSLFEIINGYLFIVSGFNTSTENEYVAFRGTYLTTDICSGRLPISSTSSSEIRLGSATGGMYTDSSFVENSSDSSRYVLNFLKRSEEVLFTIPMTTADFACSGSYEFGFGPDLDSTNECTGISDFEENLISDSQVNVSNLAYEYHLTNDSYMAEIFLLGTSNGGSGFLVQDASESQFETGQIVNAIMPVVLLHDSSNEQFIIVDAGVPVDGTSNLIFYDLTP